MKSVEGNIYNKLTALEQFGRWYYNGTPVNKLGRAIGDGIHDIKALVINKLIDETSK